MFVFFTENYKDMVNTNMNGNFEYETESDKEMVTVDSSTIMCKVVVKHNKFVTDRLIGQVSSSD